MSLSILMPEILKIGVALIGVYQKYLFKFAVDTGGRCSSFYAPRIWMRLPSVPMPTASITGAYLCNAVEIVDLNQMIKSRVARVSEPFIEDWNQLRIFIKRCEKIIYLRQ